MRIAIMGGTFNPIHLGHLRIAEEVREAFNLDKAIFIPTYQPPHKDNGSLISPEHRLEMVRLAIKDNPFFEASDIEIKRGGRSYSVVTLRSLHEKYPGIDISFIVGTDSFNDITTWCEYEELFKLANFIVIPRSGYAVKKIGEVLPVELARRFWYDAEKGVYSNDYGTFVTYMETTFFGISASKIRESIKQGSSTRYLLPKEVEGYIAKNKLYR
ncbi:MAG: nicotinate (nicotinamide) nucleotide adenylyltransferase [Deltaproteobacteria bacterium RIFCSPLOWO2_12_FULL_43_16]|nr:MAG: nicotinate (nicotinamide) nucleotide adenylyltransferase [Deltaproteobacteria bacterium GWA2_43_19]OGQ09459.1 MAG: nicotinate (nicotinamide) nucleotide adenylyltransferase [Deltaproteobacteria bacterium RIFCSPHIGHO2_02_FULL_43_33]OGQ58106.1 MAG: nicotinate (nicotinamide) nucleotide adenylyltransferase [Deltaproteobacteria bacterium RIFCSPLOWO2_12_FULL_43_16]HBR16605.1 nicotinate-nicotinamide nucleotide adenylyltransferase [Deltaproteobacteria bacterium]